MQRAPRRLLRIDDDDEVLKHDEKTGKIILLEIRICLPGNGNHYLKEICDMLEELASIFTPSTHVRSGVNEHI